MENVQTTPCVTKYSLYHLLPVTLMEHFCYALAFLAAFPYLHYPAVIDNFGMQVRTWARQQGITPQDHMQNLSSK